MVCLRNMSMATLNKGDNDVIIIIIITTTTTTTITTRISLPFTVPMLWYHWRLCYVILCLFSWNQTTNKHPKQTNYTLLTLIALITTPVSLFGYELFSFVDNTVYQKHFKWKLQNIMRQEVCTKQLFWKFLVHVNILIRISCTVEFSVGLYWSKLNLIKTLQCIRLIPINCMYGPFG